MTRKFTRREKEELINRYNVHLNNRVALLETQRRKLPEALELKLKRRLDRVLRKLWDVKMKNILDLEREKKIEILTLFKDLEAIKNADSANVQQHQQPGENPLRPLPNNNDEGHR